MNIIVVGLGSMGKRRIRNLLAIGNNTIMGYDLRVDRREEAHSRYGVQVFDSLDVALGIHTFGAMIISVPPDIHHIFIKQAIELRIPCFVEASVLDTNMVELDDFSKKNNVLIAPSCTLYFHPAIQFIHNTIKNNKLGKLSNILYHSGQYLPDWHSYEKVSEYYVSNKATGGGREIVPFELTWITLVLGFPKRITGFFKKTIDIEGAENIEDTYNLLMDYGDFIFNLTVDVVSRHATRRMTINGDKKQLHWNWDDNVIKIYNPETNIWAEHGYETAASQAGYNKNITEQMYIDEMKAFLSAIDDSELYPNTLVLDHRVLKLLYAVEQSDTSNKIIAF